MSQLIRTLHPEIRIIDAKAGTVDYVASDETLDCYREIVRASGWQFTHFQKNAPFVDSHDYSCVDKLLGQVIDFRVQGKQLIERVRWAVDVPENKLAQLGWKMTEAGYLKAVSVGFFPVKQASKWGDEKAFVEAVKELGLSAEQAAMAQTIFLAQEQIELSACIIGANPNALAKAHDDGAVRDADLAACGFSDRDMECLHHLAASYPGLSPLMQRVADSTLAAIPFRKSQQNASPADSPDAAAEARRRDAEFLRKLENIHTT
ncbi:MAG: hypothetical protein P4L99_21705 [Chthoniobacter sp.]|nr:hypothetical protein [Chthoniobacter sp.]